MEVFEMSTPEKYKDTLTKKLTKTIIHIKGKPYKNYPFPLGFYLQRTDMESLHKVRDELTKVLDSRETFEITEKMFNFYNDRAAKVFEIISDRYKLIKRALSIKPELTPNEYKVVSLRRQCLYTGLPIETFNYNADAIIASDKRYKEPLEREKERYKKSLAIQQYVRNIKGPLPSDYNNNDTKHKMWFIAATSIYDRLTSRLEKLEDGKQIEDRFSVSMSYQDLWDLINKQEWKCAFTHLPFYEGKTKLDQGRLSGLKSSPDRLDPLKGYHKGNVEFVLVRMNMMKWTSSYSEFLSLCSDVATYAVTKYNIPLLNVNEIINSLDKPVDSTDLTL
jgi:hypothetical protein